jgi:hypothetical protein
MNKMLVIAVSALLIAALALPVSAGKSGGTSKIYKVSNTVYYKGKNYVVDTEAHLTDMFRNAFALFNPCLDTIKGCASVVLYPVEKPLDMIGKATSKRRVVKKASQKIPQPKKPEMPR